MHSGTDKFAYSEDETTINVQTGSEAIQSTFCIELYFSSVRIAKVLFLKDKFGEKWRIHHETFKSILADSD